MQQAQLRQIQMLARKQAEAQSPAALAAKAEQKCEKLEKEITEHVADLKRGVAECKRLEGMNVASTSSDAGVGKLEVSVKALRGLDAGTSYFAVVSMDGSTGEMEFRSAAQTAAEDGTAGWEKLFVFEKVASESASAKVVICKNTDAGDEKVDEMVIPVAEAKGGCEAWYAEGKEAQDVPDSSGVEDVDEVDEDEGAKSSFAMQITASFKPSDELGLKHKYQGLKYKQEDLVVKLQVRMAEYQEARQERDKLAESKKKNEDYEATMLGSAEKKAKFIYAHFPFTTAKNLGLFCGAVFMFHNFGDSFRI